MVLFSWQRLAAGVFAHVLSFFFFFLISFSCRAHLACPESSVTIPIPAGLIWPVRRALSQFLFLQGSSGLPGELCQQSTFQREWSDYTFSILSSAKNSLDELTGHCRIASKNSLNTVGSRIASATVAGVRTSASQFSFSICVAFFLKALKATEFLVAVETSFGLRTPAFSRSR